MLLNAGKQTYFFPTAGDDVISSPLLEEIVSLRMHCITLTAGAPLVCDLGGWLTLALAGFFYKIKDTTNTRNVDEAEDMPSKTVSNQTNKYIKKVH